MLFRGPIYSGTEYELRALFKAVTSRGYRVIGPKLVDSAIRLEILTRFDEIPYGYGDEQAPGYYRVASNGGRFRNGPDSPKRFLYPPELLLFVIKPDLSVEYPSLEFVKTAFFGIKPCDLAAISIMDGVQGELGDEYYRKVRKYLLLIVENCVEPGGTCFCATMGTGPFAFKGFDIAYTRIGNGAVIFQPGSDLGVDVLSELNLRPAEDEQVDRFRELMLEASKRARAEFTLENLPETLEMGMDSEVYRKTAEKCFGCANCNMVCPTCFCFDVLDEPELDGSAKRVRIWDGCHSYSYAQVAGGHFRKSLYARYRHWVLHKFVYWLRQFGTFGCVGCGRCITWCPAGIDVRQVVRDVVKEVETRCKR
ncbi:MAG: 4Fe-4S dicluster domain-containing protein [Nitrososphaerota archaeon]